MGSKSPPVILMMVTLVCGIIPAVGAMQPPSAFAQQERTSLGEEESLAGTIVSNVLNGVDGDDKQIGDAYYEDNQDATVTVTVSRDQEHHGNEDIIGGSANDTAHITAEQHAGNVSTPLTLFIDTTTAAEEEISTPSPLDDAQE